MKKLLIVTGAGSSIEFGMPSVKDIDNLFEKKAKLILPLKEDLNKSLYTWVKEKLSEYIKLYPKNNPDSVLNFENLLFTIQNLSGISRDVFDNRIKPFICLHPFPQVIRSDSKEGVAEYTDFSYLHSYLVDKLLKYFRDKCKTLLNDKPDELIKIRTFFETLKKDFQIGFINLNYDNVILSALPDLDTGFDNLDKNSVEKNFMIQIGIFAIIYMDLFILI